MPAPERNGFRKGPRLIRFRQRRDFGFFRKGEGAQEEEEQGGKGRSQAAAWSSTVTHAEKCQPWIERLGIPSTPLHSPLLGDKPDRKDVSLRLPVPNFRRFRYPFWTRHSTFHSRYRVKFRSAIVLHIRPQRLDPSPTATNECFLPLFRITRKTAPGGGGRGKKRENCRKKVDWKTWRFESNTYSFTDELIILWVRDSSKNNNFKIIIMMMAMASPLLSPPARLCTHLHYNSFVFCICQDPKCCRVSPPSPIYIFSSGYMHMLKRRITIRITYYTYYTIIFATFTRMSQNYIKLLLLSRIYYHWNTSF